MIFLNRLFQSFIIVKHTCTSIFSKIGLIDQSKSCTQICLQNKVSCINLKLAIEILKNHAFRACTTPITNIHADFEISKPIRCQVTAKRIIYTDHRQTIGSFFSNKKKKKNTKK